MEACLPERAAPRTEAVAALWTVDDPAATGAIWRLRAACAGSLPQPVARLADLAEIVATDPAARGLIVCPRPADGLASLLRQAGDPAHALDAWCARMAPLLAAHRRMRRQVTIVAPEDLIDQVAGPAGAEAAEAAEAAPPGGEAGDGGPDRALRWLAAAALRADDRARALAATLEAAMLPAQNPTEADPRTALAAYLAVARRAAAAERSEAEAMRLLGALQETGDRLEHALRDSAARTRERDAALEQEAGAVKAMERKIQAAEAEAATQRQRIAALSDREGEQTRALAELRQDLDRLRAQQQADQTYILELEGRIGALYASTSWRITAPLRAVMRWMRGAPRAPRFEPRSVRGRT